MIYIGPFLTGNDGGAYMARRNSYGRKSYGKMTDYSTVLRRRNLRREILLWTVEIIGVVALAFAIAYYLL